MCYARLGAHADWVLIGACDPILCPNRGFRSTDGRTYRPDGFAPTVIPAVRRLANAGVQFDTHYVNAPVCCPSRSSLWSGRQPHKIPHQQTQNPSILRSSPNPSPPNPFVGAFLLRLCRPRVGGLYLPGGRGLLLPSLFDVGRRASSRSSSSTLSPPCPGVCSAFGRSVATC